MPTPSRLAIAAVLALMLTIAAAGRWSQAPAADLATGIAAWRRDEQRYYHERRLTALMVGLVALTSLLMALKEIIVMFCEWPSAYLRAGEGAETIVYYLGGTQEGLYLALVILAVQSAFSKRLAEANPMGRPRLAIGLFSLIWLALVILVAAAVPILAAWGFALCISPL